ncbi:MAG: hypothetical protein LBS42_08130 [Tannerella sp.]|jgi:hypothetical protein|nr:hypothetical protein [Tannerella sp.]
MKKKVFALIIATVFGASNMYAGNDAVPAVRKILFVGLKNGYFSSDYYTGDQIAENFDVPPDAMDEFINGEFYGAFEDVAMKKNLRLTVCDEKARVVISDLQYDYDGDVLYSNLSKIDEKEYRDVLQQAQAEYLLVFDQYYIKKEVYPYDNFAHIFHYSVYDASKNKVYDGHYRFSAFDLGTLSMLQKQIKKAADKCIRSIQ